MSRPPAGWGPRRAAEGGLGRPPGQMTTWRPTAPHGDPQPLTESLDRVARRLGVPGASALTAIFAEWVDVVGESVAAHAKPAALKQGTLIVAVDDPAWATQVRFLSSDLLRKLAEAAGPGVVDRVEVRVRDPRAKPRDERLREEPTSRNDA